MNSFRILILFTFALLYSASSEAADSSSLYMFASCRTITSNNPAVGYWMSPILKRDLSRVSKSEDELYQAVAKEVGARIENFDCQYFYANSQQQGEWLRKNQQMLFRSFGVASKILQIKFS